MDQRIEKLADVLINYSLKVKKGEKVLIDGSYTTLPLIRACYKKVLESGGFPASEIRDGSLSEIYFKNASEEQLLHTHEYMYTAYKTFDAYLSIWGSDNVKNLSGINPEKIKIANRGKADLSKIFFERMGKNECRWCGTQFPTNANAQEGNMSLYDYEDFVYGAMHLDKDDPVAHWKKIEGEQKKICDFLDTISKIRIVAKDTDISMSVKGRKWINCCGTVNFPDGEVFTGPVEDTVNGTIRFSFPGIYAGQEIEDISLTFENGKVVKAIAAKGEKLLHQLIETDKGAKFVGEIAVGTNMQIQKFTKNMLFDEKIGGTVHLALGHSLPESGGKNESSIHWDMLCDMKNGGTIYADDKVIYKDGKFVF